MFLQILLLIYWSRYGWNSHVGLQENMDCWLSAKDCHHFENIVIFNMTSDVCTKCGQLQPSPPNTHEVPRLKLLCHTETSLIFHRGPTEPYLYSIQSASDVEYLPLFITNASVLAIQNLKPGEKYRLNLQPTLQDSKIFNTSLWYHTLFVAENFEPGPVTEVGVVAWQQKGSKLSVKLELENKDSLCNYDLYWHHDLHVNKAEIRSIDDLFDISIDGLEYNTNYTLLVNPVYRTTRQHYTGKTYSHLLTTPSCLQVNNGDLNVCAPDALENVLVDELALYDPDLYDVVISWKQPRVEPTQVLVKLQPDITINDNRTNVLLEGVRLGETYKIEASATSTAGSSDIVTLRRTRSPTSHNHDWYEDGQLKYVLGLLLLGVIATVFGAVFIYIKRQDVSLPFQLKQGKESENMFKCSTSFDETPLLEVDEMLRVSRDDIDLFGILGEGAFGIVRKGTLKNSSGEQSVAVKTLREKPTDDDKEQFLQEILLLQSIGRHPHIVSMVGCVPATSPQDMLLIVEFCAHGDLQRYLQDILAAFLMTESLLLPRKGDMIRYHNWDVPKLQGMTVNKLYEALCVITDPVPLQTQDLIMFAYQVAEGMEFLAGNRIIHRDLATRNVLVTEQKTVKISDFGLSRDVYENNYYIKTGLGKLPLRWMAIESLLHNIYTSQSDVWSFGVLLWEIMTFGSMPYADVTLSNLVEFLTVGNRLPQPPNTSINLYNIMLSCWNLKPFDRPRFSDLKTNLYKLAMTPETLNM